MLLNYLLCKLCELTFVKRVQNIFIKHILKVMQLKYIIYIYICIVLIFFSICNAISNWIAQKCMRTKVKLIEKWDKVQ